MPGIRRKRGADDASSETLLDEFDITTKVAVATASPSLVSLHSRHVPEEMAKEGSYSQCYEKQPGEDIVFEGCGIIIECEPDVPCKYSSTIITVANLFVRTNGVQPHQIMVDVYLSDGKLCRGRVLACDFHYNLAAVRIITNFPLQIATLRDLDDVLSIQLKPDPFLQQPSHSSLFMVLPGTNITHFWRTHEPSVRVDVFPSVYRSTSFRFELNCNELCWAVPVMRDSSTDHCGGTVVNSSGEVIGISVLADAFLPVNIISRWWLHFKRCGQYRRPWLGVEVANLHSSHFEFLIDFMVKFPDISTGVVITKVVEDSPASISGLCPSDVIVECNGTAVCSKLQFFGTIWDMIGESLEVEVLRVSNGKKLKLSLSVGETPSDKFYGWPLANWITIMKNRRNQVSSMRHVKRAFFPLRLSRMLHSSQLSKNKKKKRS